MDCVSFANVESLLTKEPEEAIGGVLALIVELFSTVIFLCTTCGIGRSCH